MEDNNIGNIVNTLNTVSKVYIILESIKNSKYRYIEVVDPKTDTTIMKIKLNLDEEAMMDFLDTFFDNGFIIRQTTKKEFDTLQTEDIMKFKI
jgi:hypothetical protein